MCVAVCLGDVFGVISVSRDYVDQTLVGLCDQLTVTGWLITPVLLAADEWRAQWSRPHHHHHHQQQQQHWKLY